MNTVVRVLNLMHNHYFRCQMGNGKNFFGEVIIVFPCMLVIENDTLVLGEDATGGSDYTKTTADVKYSNTNKKKV